MLKKNILVPIASGIEELECVTIIDVLRRACLDVRVCSIEEREITGAHGIKIVADSLFLDEDFQNYDALILPGGSEGAERFYECSSLVQELGNFVKTGRLVGAICASPALVLARAGLLDNVKATCYPAYQAKIPRYAREKVVVDGNIVTSEGPGTALDFSLKLVEILAGPKTRDEVKAALLA
jgi:4-methyl-5(b-hydroxyethyl)-thiazole monophosphate biosynthesis